MSTWPARCVLEQPGRADRGEDRAAHVIGDDDRHRQLRAVARGAVADERLEPGLEVAVDGEADGALVRAGGERALGEMRGEHREIAPRCGHALGFRRLGFLFAEYAGGDQPVEDAVARGARRVGVAVGTARLWRLRQRDKQRRLGDGEPGRLLAEIGEARGADALDVAAIGREHQVEGEDLVLGEARLELLRHQDLAELSVGIAGRRAFDQAGNLHGERRAAGDDPAAGQHELPRGADQRVPIDAVVLGEAPVLVGDEQLEEALVDIVFRHRQAPAAVGDGEGTEQPPVAVEHHRRRGDLSRRGRLWETRFEVADMGEAEDDGRAYRHKGNGCDQPEAVEAGHGRAALR